MRAVLLLSLLAPPAGAMTIATEGTPAAAIVVAEGATPAEQTAARDLADYLGRAIGTAPAVVVEAQAPANGPLVLVGPTAFARAQGIAPAGPEEWAIRTVGDRLILTGGRPRGTLYAVYHFLEDIVGVRWWTPWDESVPPRTTLQVADLDLHGQPAFDYRDIYDELPAPKLFALHNRLNGHFTGLTPEYGGTLAYGPPYHVHTFDQYVPPAEYGETHPEYFSLLNGQRQPEGAQLCLTNPEVFQLVLGKLRHWIETSQAEAEAAGAPPPLVFDVSQNDRAGACQCDPCQAIAQAEGSEAGPLIDFVNRLADAIGEDHPDCFIDTLAYQYTEDPPKTLRPRDNVIIRLCDINGDPTVPMSHANNQRFHDNVVAWAKIAKHLRIWDYAVTYGEQNGLPMPSLRTMAPDYRFFLEHHVEGMFIEHEYPVLGDLHDLKTWVQMKLLEDPYADPEALTRTFTDGFYGPAGAPVREYLALLGQAVDERGANLAWNAAAQSYTFLDLDFCVAAERLFDQAEQAAGGDETLLRRVRHARLPLDRAVILRWKLLCGEHAARGGSAEDMPLDRDGAIGPRCLATLREQFALRFAAGAPGQRGDAAVGATEAALRLPGFVALPARFRDLPRGTVTDFTPEMFRRWQNQAKLVPDADAELGVAAQLLMGDAGTPDEQERYRFTAEQPMPWGIYDVGNRKGFPAATIGPADVTGPGYHWYKLENVPLATRFYVYFFWSWVIQCDVDPAVTGADPEQHYDIYASIKFAGPWFPHGRQDEPNAISVERIVVVRR